MEKNFQIERLSPILKQKILSWDEYKDKNIEGYENILKYVIYNDFDFYFKYINKDIEKNFTAYNKNNELFSYVLKENDDVKCFMSCMMDGDIKPDMYIQAIVSHPLHQHEGNGTVLLKNILKNHEKYLDVKPVFISALVDTSNLACHKFLKQFGQMHSYSTSMNFDKIVIDIDYDRLR